MVIHWFKFQNIVGCWIHWLSRLYIMQIRYAVVFHMMHCIESLWWYSTHNRDISETQMREKYSNLNWNLGCWISKNHFIRKFICHKILSTHRHTHRHTSTKSKRKSIDFTTKIPKMICFYLYVRLKINLTSIERFRFYFHIYGYTNTHKRQSRLAQFHFPFKFIFAFRLDTQWQNVFLY